ITDAPLAGGGSVYRLDQTTNPWTASKVTGPLASGHGIYYDRFTGHFLVDGATTVDEWDTAANTVVRTWNVDALMAPGPQHRLDQGWADGLGDFFVFANSGTLLYLNLASPSPKFVVAGNFGEGTDDVAG